MVGDACCREGWERLDQRCGGVELHACRLLLAGGPHTCEPDMGNAPAVSTVNKHAGRTGHSQLRHAGGAVCWGMLAGVMHACRQHAALMLLIDLCPFPPPAPANPGLHGRAAVQNCRNTQPRACREADVHRVPSLESTQVNCCYAKPCVQLGHRAGCSASSGGQQV